MIFLFLGGGVKSVGTARDCVKFFGYPLLTQERVKLWTSNLAGTFIGCIRTKARKKILKNRERGRIQGLSKLFGYPLLCHGKGQSYGLKILYAFAGSIGTKAREKFGKSSCGRSLAVQIISMAKERIARSSLR